MRYHAAATLLASTAAIAFMAGCSSDAGTLPTSPQSATTTTTPATPSADRHPPNPIVRLFYGIGALKLPLKGSPDQTTPGAERFVFSATMRKDGTVSGFAHYASPVSGGITRDGTAICVANIGDGVWALGFTMTNSSGAFPTAFGALPPPQPGNVGFLFAVKDNDAGFRRSAPDEKTGAIYTTVAYVHALCASPATFGFSAPVVESAFLNTLESGFIEVLPQ